MSYPNIYIRAAITSTQFVQETKTTKYSISIMTHYKSWEISKRFSDFTALHKSLKKKKEFENLPVLPPKRWFNKNSVETINERTAGFECYLNKILNYPTSLYCSEIVTFIQIDDDVLRILLVSQAMVKKNTPDSYRSSFLETRSSETIDPPPNPSDNLYCNIFLFSQNQRTSTRRTIESTGNRLAIEEFLRNLSNQKECQCSIINAFEEFYQNQIKEDNVFTQLDIELLFIGSDSYERHTNNVLSKKIKTTKENKFKGLLYYIGQFNENVIGSEACLSFLLRLLSYEFNFESEKYITILKCIELKYLSQMKLNQLIKYHKKESLVQLTYKLIITLYNNQFELEKLFSFGDYELISQEINSRL